MTKNTFARISLALWASVGISQLAAAQSKNVQGFSVALGVNSANASINSTFTNGAGGSTGGITSNTYATSLQLQYGQAITPKIAITVGFSDVLQGYGVGVFVPTGENVTITNMRSLYVAPGFFINNSTFLYAKAAAVSAETIFAGANTLTGSGFGLGATYFAGSNLFFQAELMAHSFNDSNHPYLGYQFTDQYKVNSLSAAIGYQF